MAKPTKAEREAYMASIQGKVPDDASSARSDIFKSMHTVLESQLESLKKIEEYTSLSRILEGVTAVEGRNIAHDDDILVQQFKTSNKHTEDTYLLLVEIKDSILGLPESLIDVFGKPKPVTEEDRRRSEEHTSELQSH